MRDGHEASVILPEPRTAIEAADIERVRALLGGPDPWGRGTPLHLTASALVVHPPTQRVLLRWHARQQAWLQVGGHADAGESDPLQIALREGAEETGLTDLTPWPDGRPVHLVIVPVPAAPHEPAHEHADLRFLLVTDTPDAVRPEKPDSPLRWLSLAEARELTTEANTRETIDRAAALLGAAHPRQT
ncbi:NUDIX hydrolase [Nonomuraea turcica]|uniref:NUDIX hydrolase n=1 Tax=Nonomuraea sp. G32 TaxID=3067274 RepID=UPI00273B7253|nr:NUDIX domain-containing protein [Nonomuraea sp. G32]MDP4505117.1 NUDIX domain-containing protein [Nonomuraea sp. G32]